MGRFPRTWGVALLGVVVALLLSSSVVAQDVVFGGDYQGGWKPAQIGGAQRRDIGVAGL